jgi:hypothetical protein
MNFEKWQAEGGEKGELRKIGPNRYTWDQFGGETSVTVQLAKNGRSGTASAKGEGGRRKGACVLSRRISLRHPALACSPARGPEALQ